MRSPEREEMTENLTVRLDIRVKQFAKDYCRLHKIHVSTLVENLLLKHIMKTTREELAAQDDFMD